MLQVAKHKPGGLTNVEVAVDKPQKISWRHSFKEAESGCLTDLVYAPPEALRLFKRFPTITSMDCTYNVIKVGTHCNGGSPKRDSSRGSGRGSLLDYRLITFKRTWKILRTVS